MLVSGLPRIRRCSRTYYPVQGAALLRVVRARADARRDRDLVFLGDLRLESIQGRLKTSRREVVPVNGRAHVIFVVPEHVRAKLPLQEPEADQGARVLLLPPISGAPRAVHVTQELRTHVFVIWILGWEVHEHRPAGGVQLCIEICALYINEANLLTVERGPIPD